MKNYKFFVYIFIFIVLSNLPPLNFFFKLFSGDSIVPGMSESLYITKDLEYIYQGNLGDTLNNSCYKQYKNISPMSSHTLYRLQMIEPWKFWRWSDYLTEEKWRQPYVSVSDQKLKQSFLFFSRAYQSQNGTFSCNQFDKHL
jgi:hypothetical protein